MQRKKVLTVQYIVLCFLTPIVLFLPYMGWQISVRILREITKNEVYSGLKWISVLFEKTDEMKALGEFSPLFSDLKRCIIILDAFVLIIPLLLLLTAGIVHTLNMLKGKMSRIQIIFPLLSLISLSAGRVGTNMAIRAVLGELLKDTQNQMASYMGVSLLSEDIMGNALNSIIEFKLYGSTGYFILLVISFILLIEDIFLPHLWKEKSICNKVPFHENKKPVYSEEVIMDGIYNETIMRKSSLKNEYKGTPTIETKAQAGRLIGVRGEYAGAEIPIQNGEKMILGRSCEQCNLVLNNPKVSRKHCVLLYNAEEEKYLMVNYSLNGTYLSGGQILEQGKRYHLPHGTIFRVNSEDEFKLL